MTLEHSLTRVVLVPRNGYVNRLQAWASTTLLAADLGVAAEVAWEPEPVAAATAEQLFASAQRHSRFIPVDEVTELLGGLHATQPRYLTVVPERRLVVLAGHDRGEQVFMPALAEALAHECRPEVLVIIAGGVFALDVTAEDFVERRGGFYRSIEWSSDIGAAVAGQESERPPYLGLHLRYTDRARQSPTSRSIERALQEQRDRTGLEDVFVAADTGAARDAWIARLRERGFGAWSTASVDFDRSSGAAGLPAMIDWLLLSHASTLVYFDASSFATEAAVASGRYASSVALRPSAARSTILAARDLGRALVTYPRRHGWPGS